MLARKTRCDRAKHEAGKPFYRELIEPHRRNHKLFAEDRL